MLNSKLSSFQTGVNALYNQCASYGVTPSSTTLSAISSAIGSVYNNGYSNGYNTGYAGATPYALFMRLKSASPSGCTAGKFYLLIVGVNGDAGVSPNPSGCNVLWSTSGITGDGSYRGYWYLYLLQANGTSISHGTGGSVAGYSVQFWEFS